MSPIPASYGGPAGIQASSSATIANRHDRGTGRPASASHRHYRQRRQFRHHQRRWRHRDPFNANGTPVRHSTCCPGARFGGRSDFGGGADTINFASGSSISTPPISTRRFRPSTRPGAPYLVTSNQIVVADLSGSARRTAPSWISRLDQFGAAGCAGVHACRERRRQPPHAVASPFDRLRQRPAQTPASRDQAPDLRSRTSLSRRQAVWTKSSAAHQQASLGVFAAAPPQAMAQQRL